MSLEQSVMPVSLSPAAWTAPDRPRGKVASRIKKRGRMVGLPRVAAWRDVRHGAVATVLCMAMFSIATKGLGGYPLSGGLAVFLAET